MLADYARSQYAEMSVQTSPGKLVIMLYDGALKFLRQGRDAMQRRDLGSQGASLSRAQDVICYLDSILDMSAGQISSDLRSTYRYCLRRLLTANAEDRAEYVDEVIRLLEPLRSSWDEAERSMRIQVSELQAPALAGAAR